MRGLLYLAIGATVFVAITFFEQLPVLGWLGGAISIAAWIWLTQAFCASESDWIGRGFGLVWSSIFGALTGFVGALSAWLAQTGNLFGFTTPPGERFGAAFGFIGATIGLVLWPLVGLLVCLGTARVATTSRRPRR